MCTPVDPPPPGTGPRPLLGRAFLLSLLSFFLQPMEIYVDDEAKLTLHGLVQHYVMLNEVGRCWWR